MNIYKITNRINGKVYIGQTIQKNPKMRWYGHLGDARAGTTGHLYESIRKYGPEQFDWEVIDSATTLGELNALEVKCIEHYRSLVECYNHRDGGDNSLHSAESIERMKAAKVAQHARRRAANGGKETINKRSGYKFNAPHPKKGKPSKKWSDEMKAEHSIRCLNREPRKITDELKERLAHCKGKTWKLINNTRVWMEVI